MTSNFFPILSSSPPPIEDCPEDEDDDFGTFATAGLEFDSSFDGPAAYEGIKTLKNECLNSHKIVNVEYEVNNLHCERSHETNVILTECTPIVKENSSIKGCFKSISNAEIKMSEDEYYLCDKKINNIKEKNVVGDKNAENDSSSHSSEASCNEHEEIEMPSGLGVYENGKEFKDDGSSCSFQYFSSISHPHVAFEDDCIKSNCFATEVDSDFSYSNELEIENVCEKDTLAENSVTSDSDFADYISESKENDCLDVDNLQKVQALSASSNDTNEVIHPIQNADNPIVENDFDQEIEEQLATNIKRDWDSTEVSTCDYYESEISLEASGLDIDQGDEPNFSSTFVDSDDFADFEAVAFHDSEHLNQSDSCEFADFASASLPLTIAQCDSDSSFKFQEKAKEDKISTVVNAIFPVPDVSVEENSSPEFDPMFVEQNNKSRRLWERLNESEALGCQFQWGVSHSFQQLLRSVNVDYHSILRTSSVPIFASSLSLLEPMKSPTKSIANHEENEKNQSPRGPIPPVEFDWNSSGLINPLDSVQFASTLMDLSFLSSTEATLNSYANNNDCFENEFLKPSPVETCLENNIKTPIIEKILSESGSSYSSSNEIHRPPNLSQEALYVLDQLPDFSFMRAKVLMFPVHNKI